MKSIITLGLAALLAAMPAAAQSDDPDWYFIDTIDGWDWHADLNSGRLSGDFIYFWSKTDLPPESTREYWRARRLHKVECEAGMMKMLILNAYNDRGGLEQTRSVPDTPGLDGFEVPKAGSPEEELLIFACYTGPMVLKED